MKEPTLIERAFMLVKTLASTVAWIVALVATLIRGKVKSTSGES